MSRNRETLLLALGSVFSSACGGAVPSEPSEQVRSTETALAATGIGSSTRAWAFLANLTPAGSTDARVSRNSSGATNQLTHGSQGVYSVTFPNIGNEAGGNVQVTALGSGNARCNVVNWISGSLPNSVTVNIRCFAPGGLFGNTALSDSAFTVSYVRRPWQELTRSIDGGAYLWFDNPANVPAHYLAPATYQWNSTPFFQSSDFAPSEGGIPSQAGASITLSQGVAQLIVPSLDYELDPESSSPQVTAYGTTSNFCSAQLTGFSDFGSQPLAVSCFGPLGIPVNSPFSLSVPSRAGSFNSNAFGTVPANAPATTTTLTSVRTTYAAPSDMPDNIIQPLRTAVGSTRTAGGLTASHGSVGNYTLMVPVPSFDGLFGSNVTVSSGGKSYCKVVSWNGFPPPDTFVNVACFNPLGQPADSDFSFTFSSDRPGAPPACATLYAGDGLIAGTDQDSVSSCDGRFVLTMQTDGNLVLYQNGVGALWWTGTNGRSGTVATLQGDGNFVVNDQSGLHLWATNTAVHSLTAQIPNAGAAHYGVHLYVQDDGNVVLYAGPGSFDSVLWASNTCCR
jgi:hypothetical protein